MKWYAQGPVIGAIVMMPAVGFCFASYLGKAPKQKEPGSEQTQPAPAVMDRQVMMPKEKAPTHVGKVLEAIDAKDYTYILLEKKGGEKHWFAIPAAKVTVGQEVELMQGMEMGQYTSKILNRTFENMNFSGGLVVREDDEAIKKRAHSSVVDESAEPPVKVDKATGANAFTVEELHAKKVDLAGKSITVRGKVVKVSTGIMGKNWVHLRDGSGDQSKGTHNLIATSKDVPAVGDIVTLTGDFSTDKDFGSGYKYDVIVENASIKK